MTTTNMFLNFGGKWDSRPLINNQHLGLLGFIYQVVNCQQIECTGQAPGEVKSLLPFPSIRQLTPGNFGTKMLPILCFSNDIVSITFFLEDTSGNNKGHSKTVHSPLWHRNVSTEDANIWSVVCQSIPWADKKQKSLFKST